MVDAVHGESADPRQFGVVPGSCHKNDCPTLRQTGQHDDARPRDAPRDRPRPPLRGAVGDPRGRSRGEARRGPRAARTQRRGQDDDGPGADRADRPDRGTGLGRRPRRDRTPRGGPLAGRDPDRDARAVREAVGERQPRFLRAALWPGRGDPGRAGRALPAPLLAVGPARRRGRQLQQGHEAEAGDRPRPAPRAGGRLPRRADGGARPGGGLHRARGDREPAAVGPDHRARDAQPRRGRPAVRPGRVRARGAVAGRFAGGVARLAGRAWRRDRAGRGAIGRAGRGGADRARGDGRGGRRPAARWSPPTIRGRSRRPSSGRWSAPARRSSPSGSARRPSSRSISRSWASGPTATRPPDARADRDDHPAPRVVGDHSEPAADVDDPHPAGHPHHRPARPGRAGRQSRAAARAGHAGAGPAAGVGELHARPSSPGRSPSSSSWRSSC